MTQGVHVASHASPMHEQKFAENGQGCFRAIEHGNRGLVIWGLK